MNSEDGVRKVFLGGFPVNLSALEFYQYMRQFGEIEDWRLVVHKGKSKGYGFASFKLAIDAQKARNSNHILHGKHMECNYVLVGQSAKEYKEGVKERKLFVSRLPYSCRESHLEKVFIQFGAIERVTINRDHSNNRSRGSAFVLFRSAASVQKALLFNDHPLCIGNHKIKISECMLEGELRDLRVTDHSASKDLQQTTEVNSSTHPGFHRVVFKSHFFRLGGELPNGIALEDRNYRLNLNMNKMSSHRSSTLLPVDS